MNRLVEGGQGRSGEEVEALGFELCKLIVVAMVVILAGCAWLAVSS